MSEDTNKKNEKTISARELVSCLFGWIGWVMSTMLVFCILSKLLPNPNWIWNLDRILLCLVIACCTFWFGHRFEKLEIGIGIGFILVLFYEIARFDTQEEYYWENLCSDWLSEIVSKNVKETNNSTSTKKLRNEVPIYYDSNWDNSIEQQKNKIRKSCDFTSPEIRAFVSNCIHKYDDIINQEPIPSCKYFIQGCAISEYVYENWHYLRDPQGKEYFQSSTETIKYGLRGDCDDYAILIASCIKNIGYKARIVITKGHAYSEIGIPQEEYNCIKKKYIEFLYREKSISMHKEDDLYWLSMDNTGRYPGTPFRDSTIIDTIIL